MTDTPPVMEIEGVSKRFDATQALDDVSLDLYPGEVHGIAGENGAGKSTLIKIMTGIHPADTGSMTMAGEPYAPHSSAEAQRRGVAAIYQEPSIFPDLSVAENIFIGHEDQGWLIDFGTMYAEAERLLTDLDITVNPRLPASGLTVGGQQAVEIAKAISLDVRVLIMDEPTASLSAHEVERLFRQVRRLRQSGVAVVFITHRLEELFVIADRISVFRDGRRISTRPTPDVTEDSLVREMVGRDPSDFFSRGPPGPWRGAPGGGFAGTGRRVLRRLLRPARRRGSRLRRPGGIGSHRHRSGLVRGGAGQRGVGPARRQAGDIKSPRQALERGIAYLSEDRRKLGLSMSQPVAANITLATLDRYTNGLGLLERAKERADADAMGKRLDIRTPSMATPVGLLSGGNQQKTMLAKWLNASPGVLILDEPTRGIDVGAKADVHRFIDELARSGIAIILISSDLPEVLAMSDRVAVLREGRLRAIYDRTESHRGASHDHRGGDRMTQQATTERVGTAGTSTWLRPDRVKELTLLGLIVVAVLVFSLLVDDYLSGQSFVRITTTVAIVAILAVAQGLVIISRNIDLSVGSIVGVAAYLTGDFLGAYQGAGPVVAVVVAMVVGAILGSVNGALVAYGGVPAIIVTLGTLAVFRTLLSLYSGGVNITAASLPDWVLEFYNLTVFNDRGAGGAPGIRDRRRRRPRPAVDAGPGALGAPAVRHRVEPRSGSPGRSPRHTSGVLVVRRLRRPRRAGRLPVHGQGGDDQRHRRCRARAGIGGRRRCRRGEHPRRRRHHGGCAARGDPARHTPSRTVAGPWRQRVLARRLPRCPHPGCGHPRRRPAPPFRPPLVGRGQAGCRGHRYTGGGRHAHPRRRG